MHIQVLRAAFPWVARRLLSDPDPSIRQMLVQVLYQNDAFQYRRLETLLEQVVPTLAMATVCCLVHETGSVEVAGLGLGLGLG